MFIFFDLRPPGIDITEPDSELSPMESFDLATALEPAWEVSGFCGEGGEGDNSKFNHSAMFQNNGVH